MIHVRVCEHDGAILVGTSDFVWHGIKHSTNLELSEEQFKLLMKLRRGATREQMDSIAVSRVAV